MTGTEMQGDRIRVLLCFVLWACDNNIQNCAEVLGTDFFILIHRTQISEASDHIGFVLQQKNKPKHPQAFGLLSIYVVSFHYFFSIR